MFAPGVFIKQKMVCNIGTKREQTKNNIGTKQKKNYRGQN